MKLKKIINIFKEPATTQLDFKEISEELPYLEMLNVTTSQNLTKLTQTLTCRDMLGFVLATSAIYSC